MTDSAIYAFLAARRKFIAGLLAMSGVLTTANIGHPFSTQSVIEGIVAFLGLYGIHEVANDDASTPTAKHASPMQG